jgi:YVTN family beta-propeller protein
MVSVSAALWVTISVTVSLVLNVGAPRAVADEYLGPVDIAASADERHLYVVQSDAQRIDVVNVAEGEVVRSIACPAPPMGVAVAADGTALYVTCGGPDGVVCVADPADGRISATIPVGHTACAPSLAPSGERLYVCNRFDGDVSVIDVASLEEVKRVRAIREPVASAVTPDGAVVFVSNMLPIDPADAFHVAADITVLDTASLRTTKIRLPNGSSSVRGICVSPDGAYAYVVHILSRYPIPTTQLERGWINTNAMSIIDVASRSRINTVLLDDVDNGAANPWGVATTADGRRIVVSHAGTHELSVIDADALHAKLRGVPKTMKEARAAGRGQYATMTADDVPNHLGFLAGLRRRVPLRKAGGPEAHADAKRPGIKGPRGLAVIGSKAYVAVYFSDLLAVVDLDDDAAAAPDVIRLGPEPELTDRRRGQMLFDDAEYCLQHWQSCASCHPDGRMDALNWDLLNDGIGNPKNAKSMLLAHQTPPAMSGGVRETAEVAVRAGIRHIMFATLPEDDAQAIDEYLKTLTPVPSPHLVGAELSPAARRGKDVFFSSRINCARCHPEPLYTDLKSHDVQSRGRYDRRSEFDTPTLVEVWRTAPYMHDGGYTTIKQLIRDGRHGSTVGDVDSLTERELNDLVEFVRSL